MVAGVGADTYGARLPRMVQRPSVNNNNNTMSFCFFYGTLIIFFAYFI
jgi:hypothetical protein